MKPDTGKSSEGMVKPNTGTPSVSTNTGVSHSLSDIETAKLDDNTSRKSSQLEDSSIQEETPSTLLEEEPWTRLTRADMMRKVRQERNRLENDRKVATSKADTKDSNKDTRDTRREEATKVNRCQW